MAALIDDLAQWIINNSLATAKGTDVFCDFVPDQPDAVVVINEYGSVMFPEMNLDSGIRYVGIAVRNSVGPTARDLAHSLFLLFNTDETVSDLPNGRWAILHPRSMPFCIGLDEKRRFVYAFNVSVTTNN
jgi:hypothetical protein